MDNRELKQKGEVEAQNNALTIIALMGAGFLIVSFLKPSLIWPLIIGFALLLLGVLIVTNMFATDGNANVHSSSARDNADAQPLEFDAFADALLHPAYVLDGVGSITFANQASVKTFGKANMGDLIFVKFRKPDFRKTLEEAIENGRAFTTNYFETVPDERYYSVEMSPIEGGVNDEKFLLSFHDLTDVKRVDKMRSDFIANASHELRTPLASVRGYLETLQGSAKEDEAARERFTHIMLDQTNRMTRLVNDLLSLSQIEMKSHIRPSEAVNLTQTISNVVLSLEAMAAKLGVKIKFDKIEGVHVIGDKDELQQVFENLIENACKYGEEGKRIKVKMQRKKHDDGNPSITVSIKDNGPGISLEDQHRITERFYRVDVDESREKQGTGLGLAIVKHILNRHGNKLDINSRVGKGSKFSVTFPIKSCEKQ